MIIVDVSHPRNAGVVAELRKHAPEARPLIAADEADNPYFSCGCHPEIVERIWDQLGADLPRDARCLLYGRPCLVQPESGVVLAFGFGTSYVIRIPDEELANALAGGYSQSHYWTVEGSTTDLVKEYGSDWVFGTCGRREPEWCRTVRERFARRSPAAQLLTPDTPAAIMAEPGALVLRVNEGPAYQPSVVLSDPDAAAITAAVRRLSWDDITFVTLSRGEDQLEVSGSRRDGFSASYIEHGLEHVIRDAPADVDELIRILLSYRSGDDEWRRLGWD